MVTPSKALWPLICVLQFNRVERGNQGSAVLSYSHSLVSGGQDSNLSNIPIWIFVYEWCLLESRWRFENHPNYQYYLRRIGRLNWNTRYLNAISSAWCLNNYNNRSEIPACYVYSTLCKKDLRIHILKCNSDILKSINCLYFSYYCEIFAIR